MHLKFALTHQHFKPPNKEPTIGKRTNTELSLFTGETTNGIKGEFGKGATRRSEAERERERESFAED